MSQERTEQARNFLAKLLPGQSLESLDPAAATEAHALERVSPEYRGTVESAAVKLSRGETLNPAEQFAVEAIIIPDKRPAIDIIAGDYNVVHPLWTHFNGAAIKAALRPTFASIGRIELPGNPTVPYGGTGFVVGNGLVMTNRHVAEIFCSGLGVRGLVFRAGYQAGIDFLQEKGSTASQFLQVQEVVMIHPYWDMALLRVEGLDAQHPMLALSQGRVEDRAGQDVAVIGYPAFDPRNDVNVQNTVFGGVYYIKRLQPGKLNVRGKIESFGRIVSAVTHDSSTLGGNSGSAVIDPGSGQVVGLHFAGLYLKANYAVPAAELARDPRVVDAGVNFKPAAAPEAGIWNDWWAEADPAEEASETRYSGDDAPAVRRPQAISARSGATVSSRRGPGQSSTWTIPIEITVRIGDGTGAEVVEDGADAADTTEKMVEPIHDTDYVSRTGYDSKFLGLPVPLPEPTDQTVVAHIDDGSYALHYHHFSIVMHKRRRLALFTASNVDASKTAKAQEAGKKFTRGALGGLGKSDVEKWFMDPRIPELHQLPDRFLTKDKGAFDKGHLVRRDDVAWGGSFADVQLANGDTFHTTNCSPQIAKFNRPDQKSNWGELEKFIFKQADRERFCLFAGPVLADDDQTFTGLDDRGSVRIQIPSQFWKVVVAAVSGELQSYAFLLRQDLRDVPLEFAVTPKWRRHMISIPELEGILGLVRFPDVVRRADQAGTEGGEVVRRRAGIETTSTSQLERLRRGTARAAAPAKAKPVRDQQALSKGPLTFRDHFLSLYQSAVAEVAEETASPAPAAGTESMSADPRAKLMLAAERVAQASANDRTVSHSGAESLREESKALEKMSLLDHAQTCAALGLQLLQAKVLGDTATAKRLTAQLQGSTCDPQWVTTIEKYTAYFGPFGTRREPIYVTPEAAGKVVIGIPTGAKVALIGDWGTGAEPARQILRRVKALQPDVLIHLGDIYYSGTDEECRANFETIVNDVFDRAHTRLPVYTLCGNHDMYCGGVGYYGLIQRLNDGNRKQPASFFCLRTEDASWQLLAMDTGRNDYSPLSVTSALTFVEPAEQQWLRDRVQEFPGKTILLSHHQLFSAFSQIGKPAENGRLRAYNPQLQALFEQLAGTGRRIPAWFWGHEHNLCIYEHYNNLERGRCIGHSAIPVFADDTPYEPLSNLQNPPRTVPNSMLSVVDQFYNHGFAMLTLTPGAAKADYYEDMNATSRRIFTETIS